MSEFTVYTYTYTYIYTFLHIYLYIYIYIYMHVLIHIYMYTHIYICTHIHIYVYYQDDYHAFVKPAFVPGLPAGWKAVLLLFLFYFYRWCPRAPHHHARDCKRATESQRERGRGWVTEGMREGGKVKQERDTKKDNERASERAREREQESERAREFEFIGTSSITSGLD